MIVRYGDEFMVGLQHKDDAEPCVSDLRERFHRFHLARHPDKTRLIECGRGQAHGARGVAKGNQRPSTSSA